MMQLLLSSGTYQWHRATHDPALSTLTVNLSLSAMRCEREKFEFQMLILCPARLRQLAHIGFNMNKSARENTGILIAGCRASGKYLVRLKNLAKVELTTHMSDCSGSGGASGSDTCIVAEILRLALCCCGLNLASWQAFCPWGVDSLAIQSAVLVCADSR